MYDGYEESDEKVAARWKRWTATVEPVDTLPATSDKVRKARKAILRKSLILTLAVITILFPASFFLGGLIAEFLKSIWK